MSLDAFAFYTDRICRKLEPDSIGDGFALPLDFHWIAEAADVLGLGAEM